jgi:DNA transposition AAA+ family ATPase
MTMTATLIAPEHLPGTDGSAVLTTPGLRLVGHTARQLLGTRGVVLVDGVPGVGKTFATRHVLAETTIPVCWADMPDTPKGKEANARIYQAVTGQRPPMRMTEYALTEETVAVLDGLTAVIVIDEAQNMTRNALRQIRFLHDRPSTTALFILIGSGVINVVRGVPELDSRTSRRIPIEPLTGKTQRELIPGLHPVLANTQQDILDQLAQHAHGNLRSWARLVEASLKIGATPDGGISTAQASAVIKLITGGAR